MTRLIAFARSARGATLLTAASAVLAAGLTVRASYDPDEDELTVHVRKIKPFVNALEQARTVAR